MFDMPCGTLAASHCTLSGPHVTLETPCFTFALPRGKRDMPRSMFAERLGKHETSRCMREMRRVKRSAPQVKHDIPHGTLALPRRERDTAHCQRAMPHGKLRLRCGTCAARHFLSTGKYSGQVKTGLILTQVVT